MLRFILLGLVLLGALAFAFEPLREPLKGPRVLPGVRPNGSIQLPNQWSLRPAGRQLELGDFPVNTVLHPSGQWLAVLHAGYGTHEVVIVELRGKSQRIACRVPITQTFYGLCFSP